MQTREELEEEIEDYMYRLRISQRSYADAKVRITYLEGKRRIIADSCIIGTFVAAMSASITYFVMKVIECLPL